LIFEFTVDGGIVDKGVSTSHRTQRGRKKDKMGRSDDVMALNKKSVTFENDIGTGIGGEGSGTGGGSGTRSSNNNKFGVDLDDCIPVKAQELFGGITGALFDAAVLLTALGTTFNLTADFAIVR
jgi:hypothetical protein